METLLQKTVLFGTVKITENADVSKCKYSEYGIGFDGKGDPYPPSGGFGNNAIIFGVDISLSVHVDNKKIQFQFNSNKFYIRWYNINCRKSVFN